MSQSVYARVRITIDVPSGNSWNPTTTMDQIRKQAIESVQGKFHRLMFEKDHPLAGCRLVGEPVVMATLAEETKDG